jgi:16S rRNA C967 or C1407 C5-methylase (RsmB/RsmF family)
VVQAFLSDSSDFLPMPANDLPETVRPLVGADGVMRCLPHRHDMDGFVVHRIQRKP